MLMKLIFLNTFKYILKCDKVNYTSNTLKIIIVCFTRSMT